ncbi:hypothetical protein NITHO_310001 [Nitrolancea hollandica Lb]|uniref:Uncharacterized protein n=1 Tax=Nitrolancea hollandica Lb TaxID=1129897 RepID=I4EHE6_9BACT|nr:hypothetical protein NITHO_310001 [Nitrolancea hollandica Lb]
MPVFSQPDSTTFTLYVQLSAGSRSHAIQRGGGPRTARSLRENTVFRLLVNGHARTR